MTASPFLLIILYCSNQLAHVSFLLACQQPDEHFPASIYVGVAMAVAEVSTFLIELHHIDLYVMLAYHKLTCMHGTGTK
jgi:hypothetical protein